MPKRELGNAFDQPTASDAASELFGVEEAFSSVSARPTRIRTLDIFAVYPDLSQPRRSMPSVVRQQWDGSTRALASILQEWKQYLEKESGIVLDVKGWIEHASEASDDHDRDMFEAGSNPLEHAFMALVDLAASIHRDGLTNPITVVKNGSDFQIETGERRWLAYHLLNTYFDDYSQIPARIVDEFSVWRQATENNARADLNGIGKARQWARLMIDLHEQTPFQSIDKFENERLYYAQVADLSVPYGKGEMLMNAMGVNSRSALSKYRAMLNLPDEIWYLGDDLNVPEETLYDLARMIPDEALARFHANVLGQNNSPTTPSSKPSDIMDYAPGTKRHFSQMSRMLKRVGKGRSRDNALALKYVQEMKEWLDSEEAHIKRLMD